MDWNLVRLSVNAGLVIVNFAGTVSVCRTRVSVRQRRLHRRSGKSVSGVQFATVVA